jgi:HD-like signal output (HDOD) protein
MGQVNQNLLTRIKGLPPLPDSVIKIQQICADPNAGVGDLVKVVDKDPLLTANLLKAANSPLYGFSKEIRNVAQAVSLFGMATVKGFALASVVKNNMKIDMSPYGIDTEMFSRIAQMQSALMLNWYGKVDRNKMEILSPASFLDGIGQVIMAAELVNTGKKAEFLAKVKESDNVEDVEIEYFDVTSQEVAAEVFNSWRLEPLMVQSISGSHEPSNADDEVKPYANALKAMRLAVNVKEQFSDSSIQKALSFVKELGMDENLFQTAVKKVTGQ